MRLNGLFIGLAVFAAGGCGGGGSSGPPGQSGNTPTPVDGITVSNNSFSPSTKTIQSGQTVSWAWNSCSGGGIYGEEVCVAHNVTFADGQRSPLQEKGTYSRTFTAAGAYDYHCEVHGPAMAGRITVQ